MAEQDPGDGLAVLRNRVERRSRQVPPPRTAAVDPPAGGSTQPSVAAPVQSTLQATVMRDAAVGEGGSGSMPPTIASPVAPTRPRTSGRTRSASTRPRTAPDEPSANLAIRVRRSLDEHLNELIFELRREGIRTSKVELIEMLLWELPNRPGGELTSRLSTFRHLAPRGDQL